jgi:hypothetical protein
MEQNLNQNNDPVHHPKHYTSKKFEVIDIIEEFELGFHLGNVVKYILRAPLKGTYLQDLEKASWYLNRIIQNCKNKKQ